MNLHEYIYSSAPLGVFRRCCNLGAQRNRDSNCDDLNFPCKEFSFEVYVILYNESNLVYTGIFSQFLIFQQNNSAQTSWLIFFTSRHYYFFEKLKIVQKYQRKLNFSYGKVSHTLKLIFWNRINHQRKISLLKEFLYPI